MHQDVQWIVFYPNYMSAIYIYN